MVELIINGPITVHVHEDSDPRIVPMLQAILAGQQSEVLRDVEERQRDMTFVEDVRTAFGQLNTRTTEIKNDQADLIRRLAENPSDAEKAEILASFNALNDELGAIASGYEPVPVTPGEVPGETPVPEPEPGTDPSVPTDGSGDGSGDGGTGDATGTGDPSIPAGGANT